MGGDLAVVGLGPGRTGLLTPEAGAALDAAEVVFGYGPYLERLPPRSGQARHASDNRAERARAEAALSAAEGGARAALVSGGDPGIFAMAAAVCEAVDEGPPGWRGVDVTVHPGITAMLALAARVGAPLGHDFCTISLSDNLKPWPLVEQRLEAAARAGFVLALYNPVSRARPWQLGAAFALLRAALPPATPVVFGRAVSREAEHVRVLPLAEADADHADMATCVIVGSPATRLVPRPALPPLVYTPRSAPI